MSFDLYNLAGLCGVALALYAYGRVQWQRDFAKTLAYSLLNLMNASLLLVSLSKEWNLAAVVSNIIWGGFSLYGIYRCLKYRWADNLRPQESRTHTSEPSRFSQHP